jgi:hypothetical protein
MSIATETLRYGWKIIAGVVLTGASIYTADTVMERIAQRDAIQVILGTVERCMATQTGTNSDGTPIYAVIPPTVTRTWTTTNGLTGTNFAWVTQTETNSLSGYTDHGLMVLVDSKIQEACPYYVDTNSVYDGTTNIVMCTFTGLLTSLHIGDGTNFTATPCWTNNPGTTNCTTNAATFGPWSRRNYRVAWQERYKVLEALRCVKLSSAFDQNASYRLAGSVFNDFEPARTWENRQTFLNMAITTPTTNYDYWYFDGDDLPVRDYSGPTRGSAYQVPGVLSIQIGSLRAGGVSTGAVWRGSSFTLRMEITGPRLFGTNLTVIKSFCQQYIKETTPVDNYYFGLGENSWWGTTPHTKERIFHSYYSGDEIYTNDATRTVKQWSSNHVFLIDFPTPIFEDVSGNTNNGLDHVIGATYAFTSPDSYLFPQFNYCTNSF